MLFGLYDLNSEFDVIPSAGLFLHASQGIGPEFSQSGVNGPSIFPTTSLGLRFKTSFTEQTYLMAAIWDGISGDPDNSKGTQVSFAEDDGYLTAIEVGLEQASPAEEDERANAKLALGFWRYSEKFEDTSDTDNFGDPKLRTNQGVYLLGEYALTRESNAPHQGLSVFARYGIANDDINPLASYLGFGLAYTGPFAHRDEDQIGLAIANAHTSDKYKDTTGADSQETAIELTYRAPINDWLTIQPDVQYIKDPGTNSSHDNALIVGLRVEVAL